MIRVIILSNFFVGLLFSFQVQIGQLEAMSVMAGSYLRERLMERKRNASDIASWSRLAIVHHIGIFGIIIRQNGLAMEGERRAYFKELVDLLNCI